MGSGYEVTSTDLLSKVRATRSTNMDEQDGQDVFPVCGLLSFSANSAAEVTPHLSARWRPPSPLEAVSKLGIFEFCTA